MKHEAISIVLAICKSIRMNQMGVTLRASRLCERHVKRALSDAIYF
jgi:hypothetical protein